MNEEIKKYIEKQKSPRKEILTRLRELFLKTLPDCDEKMTWGVITFSKNRFYIAAMKQRVHVGFAINGLSRQEIARFEGSGKTMRHIKVNTLQDIDEERLINLIKMVDEKVICGPN